MLKKSRDAHSQHYSQLAATVEGIQERNTSWNIIKNAAMLQQLTNLKPKIKNGVKWASCGTMSKKFKKMYDDLLKHLNMKNQQL